jgi:tellurite resistance protein TehA-like permease
VGKAIGEVLTYGVGVAISVAPIIAVILMLFSQRARVNGPIFLLGWVIALAAVSIIAYLVADQNNASSNSTTSDVISWGHIVLGVLLLLVAARNWRNRSGGGHGSANAEVDGGHRRPCAGKGVRSWTPA